MRIGVVGSRKRRDRQAVEDFIESLAPEDVILCGGCKEYTNLPFIGLLLRVRR